MEELKIKASLVILKKGPGQLVDTKIGRQDNWWTRTICRLDIWSTQKFVDENSWSKI